MTRALALVLTLGLAPLAAAQAMDPAAGPVSGTLAPRGGTAEVAFDVRAGTESPGPEECLGLFAAPAPDAVVDWTGGDLQIWMRAGFDATMAVSRSDGTWACDDDTDALLPVVGLAGAPAGRYAVWIGSFAEAPDVVDAPRVVLYAGPPPPPPVLDASAQPAAGTVLAEGGFVERRGAIDLSVRAGGPDEAARIDLGATPDPPDHCTGYIDAGQPTAAIDYRADGGTGALAVRASAAEDLVLVVRTPGGQVLCNDDAEGSDPAVGLEEPASGTYTVWVGTFGRLGDPVGATLSVSEDVPEIADDYIGDDYIEEPMPYSEGAYVPLDLAAAPSVRLRAGAETDDSAEVTVYPEAINPVQGVSCRGYIETAATAAVELDGGGPFALTATATGDDDLTLTVRTPSGAWFCSDDADGLNPGIQIDVPEAGVYQVWVGSFSEPGVEIPAALAVAAGEIVVSRSAYGDGYDRLRQSDGAYDGTAIRAGGAAVALDWQGGAAQRQSVQAGGPVLNPVEGEVCGGFVTERPSVEVTADQGFVVSATGDQDLTLTVLAPDGTWTCSDDADGTDPRAEIAGPDGVYAVWVGTYYRRTAPADATLRLEVLPPLSPPPPPPPTIRG